MTIASPRRREFWGARLGRLAVATALLLTIAAKTADAKPRHLEQVRTTLVVRAIRCNSCHVSNDAEKWDGAGLNPYGERIQKVAPDEKLGERIALLDHGPHRDSVDEDKEQKEKDLDVDGDGVRNWIEIIAGSNPGDAKSKPAKDRIERVERVVGCNICHAETGIFGKRGLDANPHNDFGKLLAMTVDPKDAEHVSDDELRRGAEALPILQRITFAKKKKAKGGNATYWEKLRLMREPANEDDNPSDKSLKSFRKRTARQRYKSKRDPTRGIDVEEHPLGGFLDDAKKLD